MKYTFTLIAVLMMTGFQTVKAQEEVGTPYEGWTFLIEPYLMFPNLNGTTKLGGLPEVTVDANPGDVFSNLKMGFMLNAEASHKEWHIGSDVIYMSLGQDIEPNSVVSSGEVKIKQFVWEVSGLYTVTPWLDLGLGGLLNTLNLKVNADFTGGYVTYSRDISKTWFDPMIIARTGSKPGDKFIYRVRGEIGGFGIGSDLSWQVQALAGYRFSDLFQITGGYRIIGIDYEKNNSGGTGINNNGFIYDMNTFGPEIRFGFNF